MASDAAAAGTAPARRRAARAANATSLPVMGLLMGRGFLSSRRKVDHQRVFVALRVLGALEAVAPHLVRERLLVDLGKTQLLEEPRLVGEGVDAGDPQLAGLGEAGLGEGAP